MILLEKLKQELKYDIEILNKQKNYSRFDEFLSHYSRANTRRICGVGATAKCETIDRE